MVTVHDDRARVAVGNIAPDVQLRCTLPGDDRRKGLHLQDRQGRWALLAFLSSPRQHGCAGEIAALEACAHLLWARGCEVFAITTALRTTTPSGPDTAGRGRGGAVGRLRRVVDGEARAAAAFGVREVIATRGARAMFLLDPASVVRFEMVCDSCFGQGILEPTKVLEAVQSADDCPRIWAETPGQAQAPHAPEPVPGQRFGHFAVEDRIGEGAFSTVYRARDIRLDREVALKHLLPGQHVDLAVVLHEARVGATLVHPNVCTIHDVLESPGSSLIVMEMLSGGSLAHRMRGGPIGSRRSRRVIRAIAQALRALHAVGVVHGDLKPGNVMFAADGTPKLVDFGVALLDGRRVVPTESSDVSSLRSGTTLAVDRSPTNADTLWALADDAVGVEARTLPVVCGTPAYMAPELLEGELPTPASDVWAVGVLAVELTTGLQPFRGETFVDLLLDQRRCDPRQLAREVPTRWREIVRSALVIEPDRRASAGDLARMLGIP